MLDAIDLGAGAQVPKTEFIAAILFTLDFRRCKCKKRARMAAEGATGPGGK